MRIIAGAKRGMKLLSPPRFCLRQKTWGSRPITDRVKESLFSVLYKYDLPDGRIAADLFCGVGSLGLEALSRGAEFVTFVEKDPKIIATLKKNIEKAGFAGESKVVRADAFKIGAPVACTCGACTGYAGTGDEQKYDLVFVDPPYSTTRETKEGSPLSKLLVLLSEQLSPDGIVVVRTEHRKVSPSGKRTELLEQYGRFKVIERRQWGTMAVTILQRSSE
jgi:16S rRNA (guanine966-N2)-methyltransferase